MLQFLKYILQLIVNPSRGWEDVSGSGAQPQQLCREGYYPLLAVGALSCMGYFMHIGAEATLVGVIQNAIILFTEYFATLFFAEFIFSVSMDRLSDKEPSLRKNSIFIIYCLAITVVIRILTNLVPIDLPVLYFLPIYVGFIIYKGMLYLSVPEEKTGPFMLMSVFSIIVPPYLLGFLFKLVLPDI